MEIITAQDKVDDLIKHYGGYWEPLSMFARLTEEVGELSRVMNIKFGGKRSKFEGDGDSELSEELADVLFTTLALANTTKIDLNKAFSEKIEKDFEKCRGVYDSEEQKVKCEGDIESL